MKTAIFKEVQIGNQIWMAENLNVNRFRNFGLFGLIKEVKNLEEWEEATKNERPAWCYYNFDPKFASIFGKIYNGYAVKDSRELAPKGWHIPSLKEWYELIQFLGGEKSASDKVRLNKDECMALGIPLEWAGTNDYGFSALPGSFICNNGVFFDNGRAFSDNWNHLDTSFWSSNWSESLDGRLSSPTPVISETNMGSGIAGDFSEGRYVRCIKD